MGSGKCSGGQWKVLWWAVESALVGSGKCSGGQWKVLWWAVESALVGSGKCSGGQWVWQVGRYQIAIR